MQMKFVDNKVVEELEVVTMTRSSIMDNGVKVPVMNLTLANPSTKMSDSFDPGYEYYNQQFSIMVDPREAKNFRMGAKFRMTLEQLEEK